MCICFCVYLSDTFVCKATHTHTYSETVHITFRFCHFGMFAFVYTKNDTDANENIATLLILCSLVCSVLSLSFYHDIWHHLCRDIWQCFRCISSSYLKILIGKPNCLGSVSTLALDGKLNCVVDSSQSLSSSSTNWTTSHVLCSFFYFYSFFLFYFVVSTRMPVGRIVASIY